jgi:hypothetical protein
MTCLRYCGMYSVTKNVKISFCQGFTIYTVYCEGRIRNFLLLFVFWPTDTRSRFADARSNTGIQYSSYSTNDCSLAGQTGLTIELSEGLLVLFSFQCSSEQTA